jgi:P27 family predicted phage terminase small subunit
MGEIGMAGKRRGPAPEPAAVKKAKGNSGRRPIQTAEMENLVENVGAASGEMAPPDWLNEEGQKVWEYLAPKLLAMRILQKIDTLTFGRYCQDFGRWVMLSNTLNEEGTTYESESPHGTYKRAHPAFMQADRLNRSLMAMEGGFALNPADRQRLFAAKAAASIAPDLFNQTDKDEPDDSKSPVGLLN